MPTVQDIVVEKLIEKIENEQRMPWHKPFQQACMNWFSEREYRGVNRLILTGAEYITPNQLKQYNERNKSGFWFDSGTPHEIVVFYSKVEKKISSQTAQEMIREGNSRYVIPKDNGTWVKVSWTLRYYKVYDIRFIREIVSPTVKENPDYKGVFEKRMVKLGDREVPMLQLDDSGYPVLKNGLKPEDIRTLDSKLGSTIIDEITPANDLVDKYTSNTGVGIKFDGAVDGAYYSKLHDSVHLPRKEQFASTEAYYRVLFHELIHSTGIERRLNRESYKKYGSTLKERSVEELIAEIGGLLLASEAGFREDTEWADNSLQYVADWCSWMKDNKAQVLSGMLAAERAKNYIMEGGLEYTGSSDKFVKGDELDTGIQKLGIYN